MFDNTHPDKDKGNIGPNTQAIDQKSFAAKIGHELKSPVTAIRTTAEALLAGAKNDPELLERFLACIIAETDRLSSIIDRVTGFASCHTGSQLISFSDINIKPLIENICSRFTPEATLRKINLSVHTDNILIHADELQLDHAISNLIDNAIKYTSEGGSVQVCAEETDTSVCISVSDTGVGIADADIPRLYDCFYRSKSAESSQIPGTGLGLSIVKNIVDVHDGTVTCKSGASGGTIFSIIIPRPLPTIKNNHPQIETKHAG